MVWQKLPVVAARRKKLFSVPVHVGTVKFLTATVLSSGLTQSLVLYCSNLLHSFIYYKSYFYSLYVQLFINLKV
jgi:hypothetical protein